MESDERKLGEPLKAFDLPNVSGQHYSSKLIEKEIALVAFICNHCPYVVKIIDDFSALAKKHADTVQFVTISSNDPDYRKEDSFENMKLFAKKHDFSFPYLFDESQGVAKDYGAICTPDIFVYKRDASEYKLAYHGRFEDLDKAIHDIETKSQVCFDQYPSIGCSIKWKE